MSIQKYLHFGKSRKPVYSSEHVSWLERLGEDAYVGWALIVSTSCLVALILIGYAGWLFYLVNSGGIAPAQTVIAPVEHKIFDEKSLESLIASFDSNASTTSALLVGYDGPPDPSQ